MPVFSNQYNATIDDKGRVVLPATYKKELGNEFDQGFTVELDPYEKCLNLYPQSSWETRLNSIKAKLNPNDPRQSRLLDRFYQNFAKISVSENGRLNIPNSFYTQKGIVKDVVFTGQGDRIRLWDVEEHKNAMLSDDDFKALFQECLGGGLNTI